MNNRNSELAVSKIVIVGILAAIVVVAGAGVFLMSPQGQPTPASSTQKPGQVPQQPQVTQETIINGAGATFPYPLLSSMAVEYNKLHPNIRFNYQSIGSGGGIRQHTEKTVDFGASDAPLNDKQREGAPNTLHIPITIGSVVFAYNLPKIDKGLKLTGPIIADIFLGNIKKWNDPAIQNLNAGIQLPDKEILVVHRSDGSGTTFVWTGYLSVASPEWKEKVGQSTAVQWPVGLGSSGNEGVAGLIRGTEYTAGYVELAYATTNKMAYASIQNKEGKFIEPTLESTAAAPAVLAAELPKGEQNWFPVSLLNAPGGDSYPIASFSYLLVYKDLSALKGMDKTKAKALVEFLWWATHEGQTLAPKLSYVSLPQAVVQINEQTIKSVTFNGEALIN